MTSVPDARWNNAVKIARRINQLICDGHQVRDPEGELITGAIIAHDGVVSFKTGPYTHLIYYQKDGEGSDITIDDYTKQFNEWTAVHPRHIKQVVRIKK